MKPSKLERQTIQTEPRQRDNAVSPGRKCRGESGTTLEPLSGGDHPERSIDEFKRLSGRGDSRGWRFNRDQIHERP